MCKQTHWCIHDVHIKKTKPWTTYFGKIITLLASGEIESSMNGYTPFCKHQKLFLLHIFLICLIFSLFFSTKYFTARLIQKQHQQQKMVKWHHVVLQEGLVSVLLWRLMRSTWMRHNSPTLDLVCFVYGRFTGTRLLFLITPKPGGAYTMIDHLSKNEARDKTPPYKEAGNGVGFSRRRCVSQLRLLCKTKAARKCSLRVSLGRGFDLANLSGGSDSFFAVHPNSMCFDPGNSSNSLALRPWRLVGIRRQDLSTSCPTQGCAKDAQKCNHPLSLS